VGRFLRERKMSGNYNDMGLEGAVRRGAGLLDVQNCVEWEEWGFFDKKKAGKKNDHVFGWGKLRSFMKGYGEGCKPNKED